MIRLLFQDDLQKARVLHKFLENDHAKLERLVELHITYAQKVADVEKTQPIVAQVRCQHAPTDQSSNIKLRSLLSSTVQIRSLPGIPGT